MCKIRMVIDEIRSAIEAIEKNSVLYEERNFDSRVEAIDYIEFNIIDRIDSLLHTAEQLKGLTTLKQYAEGVKRQLEEIDERLFQRIRADIRQGVCTGIAFKRLIDEYVGYDLMVSKQQDDIGYDNLDVFVNGLLLTQAVPLETKDREPEMVYYQQTPARVILELVERAHLTGKDVFYDLGSGLGQVPILVHLLSGAKTKGVEFEPAYCSYACECAAEFNLSIEFINADARAVDYSDGTGFFMYTPFEGKILQEVMAKLQEEARTRMIWIFTYGPCTLPISQQGWLECVDPNGKDIYKLGVFRSLWNANDVETA